MERIISSPHVVGTARCAVRTPQRGVPTKYERLKIVVCGAVQGVGFRPFVYRLATELKLNGWVSNTAEGVFIEVEGPRKVLNRFLLRMKTEKPPRAVVQNIESSFVDLIGFSSFKICESKERGHKTALILPDIATCGDCLREMFDPGNRRFRYPFTNCTNCGPRFSIIEALPYDRANTSMRKFAMCAECDREYHDPLDRRFHAQPNACPKCGPHLELWECGEMSPLSKRAHVRALQNDALLVAAEAIRAGKILALKGVGGFQLVVDARNDGAVVRLRERKHREEKPLALMYPSIDAIRADCELEDRQLGCLAYQPSQAGGLTSVSERLLLSPEAPIVLLVARGRRTRRTDGPAVRPYQLAQSIAPRNPNLGVMLPYSPLHHLLMRELNFPIVATSGNLSDEPICIDEREALDRLAGVADLFLVHDRPIVRHVDDSVVRVICGREMILRRARGYAPLPIRIKSEIRNPQSETILAVGGHLKNSVALKVGENIFVSQHIGDLETKEAYSAFRRSCADLPRLYDANIQHLACDLHPDYLSTKYASAIQSVDSSARTVPVQHHWAHVVACMAENEIAPPALGVAWDGTGYGLDGTIWGGEFLLAQPGGSFERVAHLRQFRLPGGELAIKEPRRSAIGILHEIFGDKLWHRKELLPSFAAHEIPVLRQVLSKKINTPLTSSAGRFFDAIASLLAIRQRSSFEGQAAMELEFAADPAVSDAYGFSLSGASPIIIDWETAVWALISDISKGVSAAAMSAKIHNMLVEVIVSVAKRIGESKIVLTGGCFQNRYVTERTIRRLNEEKFSPYWHRCIPPNDGGIALGQAVAASSRH